MLYIAIAVFWVVCSVWAFGSYTATTQSKFPSIAKENYREDIALAFLFSLLGPIMILAIVLIDGIRALGRWKVTPPKE